MGIIEDDEYLKTKRQFDEIFNVLFEKERQLHINFNKAKQSEKEKCVEQIKTFNLLVTEELKKIIEKIDAP